MTDNRMGVGVGILLYQCHHSVPTNAIKIGGVMINGKVSLARVRLIFL